MTALKRNLNADPKRNQGKNLKEGRKTDPEQSPGKTILMNPGSLRIIRKIMKPACQMPAFQTIPLIPAIPEKEALRLIPAIPEKEVFLPIPERTIVPAVL